jgi:endonuclease III
MFSFMERYMLSQINVERTEMLTNCRNFNSVIDFCLKTNRFRNHLHEAEQYFSSRFRNIRNHIEHDNWTNLKDLVYHAPGVGQKIGSLILEVLIHYGDANANLERLLFVPIDTHVHRIFTECLGLDNFPAIGTSIDSRAYLSFQDFLAENTAERTSRIVFDYLWFVGKVFCGKIVPNNDGYSRGYRLCSMCWIKDACTFPDKWTNEHGN